MAPSGRMTGATAAAVEGELAGGTDAVASVSR